MFALWGSFVHHRRWAVLVVVAAITVLGGAWGVGVFDRLAQGGYESPGSEAVRAVELAQANVGRQGGDVMVIYLPWMALLLVTATLVLMFLAFGSVLLPVKAVVASALSLVATFGALTWVFQDGHGTGLLGVTPGPLDAGMLVLMAALVFGLSTDYETFLLSRMVEARRAGASSRDAVVAGLASTGRVISAAALLLIVVTGAFAFSPIAVMRFVGVGMIFALALDATVVRMLLVPALLRLLGDAAWWAPAPLRRLQRGAGLGETVTREADLQPVG
jgi:trehalose monomycolate/heme transporter